MRLPNGSGAQVDLRKLTDYVLNPQHPRGRNKARVFAAALNLERADARALRDWLLQTAASADNALLPAPQLNTVRHSKSSPKCAILIGERWSAAPG